MFVSRVSRLVCHAFALVLAGCPAEVAQVAEDRDAVSAAPPTHTGLVSVQDIAIANLPAAGHGLTVSVFFQSARRPTYEERPGDVTGCRGWSFDTDTSPPPAEEDHGTLTLEGLRGGTVACRFTPERGYVCPTAQGTATATTTDASGPTSRVSIAGATFTPDDVGRHLATRGATTEANNGAFAIVAVISATDVVVVNPRGVAETFEASYRVLAGAGPVPNDLYRPFQDGVPLGVALAPGGGGAFTFPAATLAPGAAFSLDDDSRARIMNVPVTGAPLTLACAECGSADGTIVRISSTDGDVSGLSPVAMPRPRKKAVEIQCVALGTGTVTVPAEAMALLRDAHAISPATRIRTAFMRDGLAIAENAAPSAPNRVALAAGHGVLGFTDR